MASTTYYCDNTADGMNDSTSATYLTAVDGNVTNTDTTTCRVGQNIGFACKQAYLSFDLSSACSGNAISAGATINSTVFSVLANTNSNATTPPS